MRLETFSYLPDLTAEEVAAQVRSVLDRGLVVGIGCLWRRTSVEFDNRPVFSLVSRDFPTYDPDNCPFCKRGVPLNEEFVRRRHHRKPSSVQEPKEV